MIEELKLAFDFLKMSNYRTVNRFPLRKYPLLSIPLWINEIDVFRKFLFRGNNLFSISLNPSIYLSIYYNKHLLILRDLFFLNKSFPLEIWGSLFPKDWIGRWQENNLLREEEDKNLRFIYRVVPYDGHFFVTSRFERTEPHFTFLSYDSFYFASFLNKRLKSLSFGGEQALDMCCGVGIQAFAISQFSEEVIGVDINPNAVYLACINASINQFRNCEFKNSSFFDGLNNSFDLIVSNPPFIFSENTDSKKFDSHGGEPFGLNITLALIKTIPDFLKDNGRAFIITRVPVFAEGDYLFNNLANFLHKSFGFYYHYVSDSIVPLESFEMNVGIKRYRHIILEIFKGNQRKMMRYSYWHRRTSLF
ncbi:MAG: class I SAM-dependent methyltransferase [Planctomycetes bacterium]|nr:class I SAM-dependent methyltransferase [Planctomycetota bacterium]